MGGEAPPPQDRQQPDHPLVNMQRRPRRRLRPLRHARGLRPRLCLRAGRLRWAWGAAIERSEPDSRPSACAVGHHGGQKAVRREGLFEEAQRDWRPLPWRAPPASRFAETNRERTAKRCQISVAASMPSPSPIRRTSISTRSGRSRSTTRTASAAESAVPTTVCPARPQMRHQVETDEDIILHDDDALIAHFWARSPRTLVW